MSKDWDSEGNPIDSTEQPANPPSAWEGTGAPQNVMDDGGSFEEQPATPPSAWEGTGAPQRVTDDGGSSEEG